MADLKADTAQTLASLKEARQISRDSQSEFREVAFNLRRMLDDPASSYEARRSAEEQLFDVLQALKESEQTERDIDESIASISLLQSQVQSNENVELVIGMVVVLIVFVVVLAVVFQ
ncbi:MAG: hypothetical protein F4145_03035 [Boseongicola sp. SB0675_bin_26]|nr:hypothetical protein [Boseongicola sp. SB0675_bin_26]